MRKQRGTTKGDLKPQGTKFPRRVPKGPLRVKTDLETACSRKVKRMRRKKIIWPPRGLGPQREAILSRERVIAYCLYGRESSVRVEAKR